MKAVVTRVLWGSVVALAVGCGGGNPGSKTPQGTETPGLPSVPGQPDTSVQTALPPVPSLVNVKSAAVGDSVNIAFDPIEGARDYRVYVLPDDSAISSTADGFVTSQGAIYRCAGDRQMPEPMMDSGPDIGSGAVRTLVDNQDVEGYTRSLAEATLGHVYMVPGEGRVPVYALGESGADGDNSCFFMRWSASRAKRYVVSETERTELLGQRFRDDGIVFYVPADAGDGTLPIFTKRSGNARLYYAEGPEADTQGRSEVAFNALSAPAEGTQPLMRVFYKNSCGISHDELVAGKPRFDQVRQQGDEIPMTELHWSGISAETVLVVEALDVGCPHQGTLGPSSRPSVTPDSGITYEPWLTLDDFKAASPTGEVYLNAQHEAANKPRPIARTFVRISPGPVPELDWFAGFDTPDALGQLNDTDCGADNCFQQYRKQSDLVDLSFMAVEPERYDLGPILGELVIAYADWAADVNGKFRMTPKTKATVSGSNYLHATMRVDAFTTGRRYPQILISDQDAPVQNNLEKGKTLIVQTFGDWPPVYQLEVCKNRTWDVNNQCPAYDFYHVTAADDPGNVTGLAPNPEVGERTGVDRATTFDVYVSTARAYLFLDGEPYGCANLTAADVPSGSVTVTFGDVLYHSGVDHVFDFHETYQKVEGRRHFDNLGFKSGVGAPIWDEARFPCTSNIQ